MLDAAFPLELGNNGHRGENLERIGLLLWRKCGSEVSGLLDDQWAYPSQANIKA